MSYHQSQPMRRFQFLIVRLKVRTRAPIRGATLISIPYSSIKRLCNILYYISLRISIPYSSIKSRTNVAGLFHFFISIPYSSIKRQNYVILYYLLHISIPYSSIKSMKSGCACIFPYLFQFLIVRLKVLHTNFAK